MPYLDSKHPLASKTLWINALTVLVAVLVTLSGMTDNIPAEWMPWIVSALAVANFVLRFLTVGPIGMKLLLIGVLLCSPAIASAQTVLDTTGVAPGSTFLLTVNADGTVTIRPTQVVRLITGTPAPPPPTNPPATPLTAEVERQTQAAIAAGGSKTTAAGLSAVYSLVAGAVADGSIPPDSALAAIKAATDTVLANQADAAKWAAWRTSVGGALEALRQQGQLTTKEQYAAVLGQIASGAKRASGLAHEPRDLVVMGPRAAELGYGLFENIDIARLIELIKLVMELLKLFGLGK